jgi:tetratricopeptide (TPR) repeat protein
MRVPFLTTVTPRRTSMGSLSRLAVGPAFGVLLIPLSASPGVAADLRKDCQSGQIAACTQILQSNPADITALANRGVGFRVIGEYGRAVADLDAAVRLDPRIAGLYLERGLAHDATGEHLLAVIDFTEAIGRDPTLVQAYFGRAMAYEASGERERSVADLSNARRLDPNLVAALHMQRGNELRADRQYDEAISAFDRAIDAKSNWPLAYFGRGASFEDKGDTERAAADYRRCIELNATTELERRRQQEARARLTNLSRS